LNEEEMKEANSDDDHYESQTKPETGVLFGAAYENTYIDILENEEVESATEINERLLEISLGMDKEELKELTKIEIIVDTTNTHMQHVGEVLRNLEYLKLNDSVIPSVRDLGTSFRNLKILSLSRWELRSLAGLSSFEFLKELYASYNDIQDLYDLSYWYHLEVLDLEGNNISKWDNVSFLVDLDKLVDVNLSWNPISREHNYQNRVKQLLSQVKFIDDFYIDAIKPEDESIDRTNLNIYEYDVAEERQFILSKFAKFSCLKIDDLLEWTQEALDSIHEEDSEEMLIKKKVKRHDRKSEAFQKETFDVFDYNDRDDELENEEISDDASTKDTRKQMYRSWTNSFFRKQNTDMIAGSTLPSRQSAYDDSDSLFRSSLRGLFTGKDNKKTNLFLLDTAKTMRDTWEYSTLVTSNDTAVSGNPIKALKCKKNNLFSTYRGAEAMEAKGIEELISEFNSHANTFKRSMKNLDVAEKIKQNQKNNKLKEWLDSSFERKTSSSVIPKDKIKLSQKLKADIKAKPIKADHIVIKKSMMKMHSQS
jgi:hypothetical protein